MCDHRFIYPKDTGTIGFGPDQLLGENANWAAQAPLVATIDAMGLPEAERFAFSCAQTLLLFFCVCPSSLGQKISSLEIQAQPANPHPANRLSSAALYPGRLLTRIV